MTAEHIIFGEHPPGLGGQYESEVVSSLCKKLSNKCILILNPSFPRLDSFFYEYDLILINPFYCYVIEIKYFFEYVKVYDDWLEGVNGFQTSAVFSLLENKAKVLRGKFNDKKDFLYWPESPYLSKLLIVGPNDIKIIFKQKIHEKNNVLVSLSEAINIFQQLDKQYERHSYDAANYNIFKKRIKSYCEKLKDYPRSHHKIGRFFIKKTLQSNSGCFEYLASDEPPCKTDVHLKEYPFNNLLSSDEIEAYLSKVTIGMQILRNLRHQYLQCIIGHFQTGYSLIQISDWFDGESLETKFDELKSLSLYEKIGLMKKIAEGLSYCHSRGVFHRNISAENILISDDIDDLRITNFDFAKDISISRTLSTSFLQKRNRLIIPPEELLNSGVKKQFNLRLYDIFQTGLLFYRILENGTWPYKNALDYCTNDHFKIEYSCHSKDHGFEVINTLITNMLLKNPVKRVDPMEKIIYILNDSINSNL